MLVLVVEAALLATEIFMGKTGGGAALLPLATSSPQRVGVRSGVELVWGDVQG